jgi:hypothetical protein
VLDPIPSSVTILHSDDESLFFELTIWLHFTITPEDFDKVLASEAWEVDTSQWPDSVDNTAVLEWWHPEVLEPYTHYSVKETDCDCLKEMWVNEGKTEVYFRELFY